MPKGRHIRGIVEVNSDGIVGLSVHTDMSTYQTIASLAAQTFFDYPYEEKPCSLDKRFYLRLRGFPEEYRPCLSRGGLGFVLDQIIGVDAVLSEAANFERRIAECRRPFETNDLERAKRNIRKGYEKAISRQY
jgi:hypothetical protein